MASTVPCYCLPAAEAAKSFNVDVKEGLPSDEVARRQNQFGPNEIEEKPPRSVLQLVVEQFSDFMILVLIAAAIISGIVGDLADTITILIIVLLNAAIGAFQAWRAEKAMAALKKMGAPSARVLRNGRAATISAVELVPGDIIVLEAGDIVPADIRLIDVTNLKIDESMLTGESVTVDKQVAPLTEPDLPVSEQSNLAFKGTIVAGGRARGIAASTGMRTELGKIAALLDSGSDANTPLQKRLAAFGKKLGIAVLIICAVIFLAGLLRGEETIVMFLTAVSLAVAAIPEALPAVVTISLALGARKMVLQEALVRRLPAVETLGSVTYICSDKTGTLTQNRMTVDRLFADNLELHLAQTGNVPNSKDPWFSLIQAMALCHNAEPDDNGVYVGDPTETAIARAAQSLIEKSSELEISAERILEFPFDSERKRMTTVYKVGDEAIAFVKGAPEVILARSTGLLSSSETTTLDKDALARRAEHMAEQGLRVIAFAKRQLHAAPTDGDPDAVEENLVFLGFAGLIDPPRENAKASVELCKSAGITPIMITGDHPVTAKAIAQRLDIISNGGRVVTGRELADLSDEDFQKQVEDIDIFARVDPAQKIRIVEALQERGEFVAMTGDGVNDAPALKRADIGIAMGKGGTDVAREASSLVLLDDNFSTIVSAVKEGRRIFDNIRKFIKYTMTSNAGEVWTIFLAPFLGLPIPLLPIHILWINLVTDGLPGLALTVEKAERGIMDRPPREPDESILAHGIWQHIVWCGLTMGFVTIGAQIWAVGAGKENWQTIVFTVLTLSQMGHVLAIRTDASALSIKEFLSNRPLLGAVALTFLLQLAVIYVPFLNPIFHTAPLSVADLLVCIALSSIVFLLVEAEKLLFRGAPCLPPRAIKV